MRIERTQWPPPAEELDGEPYATSSGFNWSRAHQPAFGISVGWNEPDRGLKPFLVIWWWRWRVQVGYLVD